MSEDGDQKDDVRLPDSDIGTRITKLFTEEEKETSMFPLKHILLYRDRFPLLTHR